MTTKIPRTNHRIRPHRTVMPAARPDLAGQWRAPGPVGSWEAGLDCASANDYPRIVTPHYRRFRGSSEVPSRSLPGKVQNLGCRLAEEEPHTTISRVPCMSTQRMAPRDTSMSEIPIICCMVNASTPTRITFWIIADTPTSTRMFRSTLWYLR